ncbi:hypothetical protein SESBI_15789 [Sesbania bispinosa]|nr:hypothetical protein SESBI_15789 [Sesbania bispinosa]
MGQLINEADQRLKSAVDRGQGGIHPDHMMLRCFALLIMGCKDIINTFDLSCQFLQSRILRHERSMKASM